MLGQYPFQAHTFIERDPVAFKSIQYITYTRQRRHFAESPLSKSLCFIGFNEPEIEDPGHLVNITL